MDINNCLRQFKPISLKDMNSVSLMNRTDVKFLFKKSQLPILLSKLTSHYNLLKIEKINEYNISVKNSDIERLENQYFKKIGISKEKIFELMKFNRVDTDQFYQMLYIYFLSLLIPRALIS